MPTFGSISVIQTGSIARVAVRWPGPCGSIDSAVLDDFERLVDWIEDETPCDVLVLTATSRSGNSALSPPPDLEQCRRWEKQVVRVDRLPCISVAAIDGSCVRFWMQLALACDHRIATSHSFLQVLELKEGYLPGMNIFRLAKYLGIGVARRLVFTGAPVRAAEAASMGIVDDVCEPGELEPAIERFLARLAPTFPMAAQLARRLLSESFSTAFENFLGQYLASQSRCLSAASCDLRKAE